jgi:hypothetical protein
VLAEIFRWRSPILHLIIGALIGLGLHLTGVSGEDYQGQIAAFGAAGAVGGGAYWLIAGRTAGAAEPKPDASEQPESG